MVWYVLFPSRTTSASLLAGHSFLLFITLVTCQMNEAFLINFLKLIYDLVTGMVDGVVPGLLA
jgi:hypothetical protein